MPEQHLFEYATIRIVPRVEREEFINVGVVVYCARLKFLKAMIRLDEQRLQAFSCEMSVGDLGDYLNALIAICDGNKDEGGPIARLPAGERFRWLTATRSTVVQTSKVHPGFCEDPIVALQHLFEQMVC